MHNTTSNSRSCLLTLIILAVTNELIIPWTPSMDNHIIGSKDLKNTYLSFTNSHEKHLFHPKLSFTCRLIKHPKIEFSFKCNFLYGGEKRYHFILYIFGSKIASKPLTSKQNNLF